MNANFGIVEPLGYRVKGGKVAKYEVVAKRALEALTEYCERLGAENYKTRIAEDGENADNN